MGNNQGGFHRRERTNDGSMSQRHRLQSGTGGSGGGQTSVVGSVGSNTTNASMGLSTGGGGGQGVGDDEDPVSVGEVFQPAYTPPSQPSLQMRISKYGVSDSAASGVIDLLGPTEYPVVFKWSASNHSSQSGGGQTHNHPARNIYLTGSWDQWRRKIPLVKSTNDFSTIINLNPGRYEYKFLVDGKWVVDEQASKTDNPMGSQNNVVTIDQGDFAVFDALERDLASSNAGEAMRSTNTTGYRPSHDTPDDRELEKHREFTQTLPDRREFERAANPPVLPPHLLQVILNKDTPVQCDPNVLPEPNHVMLNHLYALSIKDGVMVLSATHRHRKKYVTTLLYKPI